jgi:hypothetical protein
VQVVPLIQVATSDVENLHAMVFTIGYIHVPVTVSGNTVHKIEMAWIGSILAPGVKMLAIGRETVHSGISIPVRDKQIARLPVERHLRGLVEGAATLIRRWLPRVTDGLEYLTIRGAAVNAVTRIICTIQRIVRAYG